MLVTVISLYPQEISSFSMAVIMSHHSRYHRTSRIVDDNGQVRPILVAAATSKSSEMHSDDNNGEKKSSKNLPPMTVNGNSNSGRVDTAADKEKALSSERNDNDDDDSSPQQTIQAVDDDDDQEVEDEDNEEEEEEEMEPAPAFFEIVKEEMTIQEIEDEDLDDGEEDEEETKSVPAFFEIVKEEMPIADGELCVLPVCDDDAFENDTLEQFQQQQRQSRLVDSLINLLIPTVLPIIAYQNYEYVAQLANTLTDVLSSRMWQEVDGGSYRASIIAPAINGVIMPACVVTFATLLSITISGLRQRQQEIRTAIIQEASELRVLQSLVDAYPDGLTKAQCRSYLIEYTSRLISESKPRITTITNMFETTTPKTPSSSSSSSSTPSTTKKRPSVSADNGYDTEMNGFFNQLIKLENVRPDLRSESYNAIARLNAQRSERISSLQTSFPALHYATLCVLALSVMSCFLLETDQDILIFLNAVQLKLLWSMLVGVFTGFAVVCYDLIDPFQGSYQISKSVDQLYIIRGTLVASVCNPPDK